MNIRNVSHCYGCGLCAIVCPQKIIDIQENEEGFYMPSLNEKMCIDCGLCTKVCSFLDNSPANNIHFNDLHSFAGWSKNSNIRLQCSSGGISYEIAKRLLEKNYKICAVKYNTSKQRAEHYISHNETELAESIGSKYIQSYTLNGFKEFNKKDKFLVIGTPCQIDSVRRYIKLRKIEDNFILIDFFCHGVPSKLLWNKYLRSISPQIKNPQKVTWRNKQYGWHDSYAITIKSESNTDYTSKLSEGDLFFKFFLNDLCLGKACYNACKYKCNQSSADIRIGDMWGKTFQKEEKGVSCIICFTSKGLEEVQNNPNLTTKNLPLQSTMEYQMRHNPQMPKEREKLLEFLKKGDSFEKELSLIKAYIYKRRLKKIINSPYRIIYQKLCKLLKQ